MPLVLLTMRPGYSASRSRNTVRRIRSVCSAETPLTLWLPRNASVPIRTRRPAFSSISDSAASASASALAVRRLRVDAAQMLPVEQVDDLHVARQQPLQQRHRPALQRLRQQGVVGVAERAGGDLPGLIPFQRVVVDQQAHQLGDRDRRMGVVQLDRRLVGQRADVAVLADMAADQILQAGRGEEILLPQPQLLPGRRVVAGIQHLADGVGAAAIGQRADMVAAVERIQAQRVRRARRPQAQRIDVLAAPADDRRVIGDRLDGLGRLPDMARSCRRRRWLPRPGRRSRRHNRPRAARIPTGCRS